MAPKGDLVVTAWNHVLGPSQIDSVTKQKECQIYFVEPIRRVQIQNSLIR